MEMRGESKRRKYMVHSFMLIIMIKKNKVKNLDEKRERRERKHGAIRVAFIKIINILKI